MSPRPRSFGLVRSLRASRAGRRAVSAPRHRSDADAAAQTLDHRGHETEGRSCTGLERPVHSARSYQQDSQHKPRRHLMTFPTKIRTTIASLALVAFALTASAAFADE